MTTREDCKGGGGDDGCAGCFVIILLVMSVLCWRWAGEVVKHIDFRMERIEKSLGIPEFDKADFEAWEAEHDQ
jgi:hypothetical protein